MWSLLAKLQSNDNKSIFVVKSNKEIKNEIQKSTNMRKPLTQRQNRALRRRASKIRKKTVKANKNAKI